MTSRPGSSKFKQKSSVFHPRLSCFTNLVVSNEMKTFLILLSFTSLGISPSACEGRIRRQLWPQPSHPNRWPGFGGPMNSNIVFSDGGGGGNPWMRPGIEPPFNNALGDDRPNQNNFQNMRDDEFRFDDNRNDDRRNQNGRDDRDRNQNGRGDGGRNQNRRTTTTLGPITSTPRTIHASPQGCSCSSTPQFNPVCGTDGNTYKNAGLLNCYRQCGTNVSRKRMGTC